MRYTGLSRQTLHNYTMMGLISPAEHTESGHRLYDESVFKVIEWIEMYKRHHSLSEVKEFIAKKFASGEAQKS
jgi:DNA-binding transcriptional MerR regulator